MRLMNYLNKISSVAIRINAFEPMWFRGVNSFSFVNLYFTQGFSNLFSNLFPYLYTQGKPVFEVCFQKNYFFHILNFAFDLNSL